MPTLADRTKRAADGIRHSGAMRGAARAGLASRAVFYLVLAWLTVRLAFTGGGGQSGGQVNANGALHDIGRSPTGLALLLLAAAGFVAYAVVRVAGAYADQRAGRLRRLSTAGQAVVYGGLAWTTASFVLGARKSGSEQQQQTLIDHLVVHWPGRLLLAAIGLVVVGVCGWQVIVGVREHFSDSLDTAAMPPWLRPVATLLGRVGIIARGTTFVPIGLLLVLAAVKLDPHRAIGLDGGLLDLSRRPWGRGVVLLIGVGFAVFAAFSALEVLYRKVEEGV